MNLLSGYRAPRTRILRAFWRSACFRLSLFHLVEDVLKKAMLKLIKVKTCINNMYNNILTSLTWIWGKSSIRKRRFRVSCGTFQTLRCFGIFCQELQNLGQQIREVWNPKNRSFFWGVHFYFERLVFFCNWTVCLLKAVTAERFSEAQELKMRESEVHWRVACHEDLIRISSIHQLIIM